MCVCVCVSCSVALLLCVSVCECPSLREGVRLACCPARFRLRASVACLWWRPAPGLADVAGGARTVWLSVVCSQLCVCGRVRRVSWSEWWRPLSVLRSLSRPFCLSLSACFERPPLRVAWPPSPAGGGGVCRGGQWMQQCPMPPGAPARSVWSLARLCRGALPVCLSVSVCACLAVHSVSQSACLPPCACVCRP